MKEESLQGYRRAANAGEKAEEVDAAWAWCNWILERVPEGQWTVRGLIDDTPCDRAAGQGRPESLVEWFDQLGISPGLSSAEYDELANDIEATLSTTSTESVVSPASAFPRFTPISNGEDYQSRIDQSREAIRQGDSYELTLTTSFTSSLKETDDPYALYVRLRTFNPAYYSTYMSFPSLSTPRGKGIHVLSSSPERFLKIEAEGGGRMVEMMPIKGTRARPKVGQCVCALGRGCEGMGKWGEKCREEWERVDAKIGQELQDDLKERAENLMVSHHSHNCVFCSWVLAGKSLHQIVDLIRADLLSCCLPSTVTVPKLIALESYGVHNLVTTVRGLLAENVGSVEAVRRCFPPGESQMTYRTLRADRKGA